MSAFIVSDATMNRIVSLIMNGQHRYGGSLVSGRFADEPTDLPDAGSRIGRALFAMNSRAITARYGDQELHGEDYAWTGGRRFPGDAAMLRAEMVAAVKAVGCLLYQCSEGRVPDEPLFAELRALEQAGCKAIVDRLPEYDAAKWDA